MTVSLVINGAFGKMGQLAQQVFAEHDDFSVLALLGREHNLKKELQQLKPDVVLDLTVADVAFENTKIILESGIRPVIGTSGLTERDVEALQKIANEYQVAGLIVPNFSLGVVLMMQFAKQASHYFSDVEIIEKHHQTKKDAPSGTAIRTMELMKGKAPIHSIRLPGLLAHQEVIFGGLGETLTVKHDALSRDCYTNGMILSCQGVMKLNTLAFGLEAVLL